MLVGMENMMMYFLSDPDYAREILHHIMDFQLGIARHYLRHGVEMVFLGDDLGTQQGPLLGPRIVHKFLEPEYRRLFELYRQHNVLIGFHSCGNVASVLDLFMDLGVNLLNPVQASANDLDQLRRVTQGRMALQGGVSSATIMEGPPERIAAEVRQRMRQLGEQGGYVCQPDQGMPYPPAHLQAFDDAVERYGRYPLEDSAPTAL
jgi:uroporphyrinogen decarboxylase